MYNNIPQAMRAYRSWVVWKLEDAESGKPTKVPYDAKTGKLASSTNSKTWCSYEEAVAVVGNYSGIGFIFSNNDPFCGIDIDDTSGDVSEGKLTPEDAKTIIDRQAKVFTEFNTYTERSPGGRGLHLICRAELKHGRRRSKMEMYSEGRFFTMTGDVYKEADIAERQELATMLWEQMGGESQIYAYGKGYDAPQLLSDEQVIVKAASAVNGDKFKALMAGDWQSLKIGDGSQSVADQALINMLAFYTQNREQITRIFRATPMGVRDKAWRDSYIAFTVNRAFDQLMPHIDLDDLSNRFAEVMAERTEASRNLTRPVTDERHVDQTRASASVHNTDIAQPAPVGNPSIYPPGLVGEIAQFIYEQSPKAVPEIALAGALALMAGICGKAYNFSGTGLNLYVMLLAPTGTGKEAAKKGISKLINAVATSGVPGITNYMGPGEIASPQALHRHLADEAACFVSVSGEIGIMLQQMGGPRANPNLVMLKRFILDLYNKSGEDDTVEQMIYADKSKNANAINSPAFSWFGESTPEAFYGALDERMVAEGLIPRFLTIQYNGIRVPTNYDASLVKPRFELLDKLGTVAAKAMELTATKKALVVKASPEADKLIKEFDTFIDDMNNGGTEIVKQLWSRANVKAFKIAALIAIGMNPYVPEIAYDHIYWAIELVSKDCRNMLAQFESGVVGQNTEEVKQQAEIVRVVNDYMTKPWSYNKKYGYTEQMYNAKVLPMSYISKRLSAVSAFRLDRRGAAEALKRAIQAMIENGYIMEMRADQVSQTFKMSAKCFTVVDWSVFGL